MIPESGSYLELKRAVLAALPQRGMLYYQIVNDEGVPVRSFFSMSSAIDGLRDHTVNNRGRATIQPFWG